MLRFVWRRRKTCARTSFSMFSKGAVMPSVFKWPMMAKSVMLPDIWLPKCCSPPQILER